MTLLVLAYLGGVLTIVSPCILPVLPFVFARADRPFLQSGLPMLVGMAAAFAVVASLAAVAGGWVVEANQYGRGVAIALLAVFGLTLVFPNFADRVMAPLVNSARSCQTPLNVTLTRPVLMCCRRSCSASRRGCCGRRALGRYLG